MNELDLVRVKETVAVTPNFEDDPIEIKAGWGGTIIAHADLHLDARIEEAKRRDMWTCSYIEAHIWDPDIKLKVKSHRR
jgi:hypothetical protein